MFGVGSYFRNIYLFGLCLQGHTEYNQGGGLVIIIFIYKYSTGT